jgi:putative transcriptional regulator
MIAYASGVYSRPLMKKEPGVRASGRIRRSQGKFGRGAHLPPQDIKAIRIGLEKSQAEFARMIGVSVSTLQNWEQGRRQPEGPARALLRVTAENPGAVAHALKSGHPQ